MLTTHVPPLAGTLRHSILGAIGLALIFVVDPAGNVRAEVYGASLEAMADVAHALSAE